MAKARVLKKIDAVLGPVFVSVLGKLFKFRKSGIDNIKSVLFIRPGGIGDAVLLISAIIALKDKYPFARITVLAEKRNGVIFALCPAVYRVLLYDRPHEFLIAIKDGYDVVIDTEQWHRFSAVVAKMTGAPMVIGFATNEREKLFTHKIPYSHDDHEIDSFFRLIRPLSEDVAHDVKSPFLTVPESALERADALLRPFQSRRFVVIFPGGSIRERQWGAARFRAVATSFAERGFGIVVVGDRDDLVAGREIASGLANALDICGKASLLETAAVLKNASLLITGDSGIMHIAYGLGTPTVSLFGPGMEKKWAPRGENVAIVNKHLPCSPCTKFGYTPRCNRGAECMKQITVDEVYEKAIALLER